MFRKFLSFVLILSFGLCSLTLFAQADTDWDAEVNVVQLSSDEDESTVTIRISIDNITSPSGIICAIYSLQFDSNHLEYLHHENALPENWNFDEGSSLVAQDWSQLVSEEGEAPYFYYTIFNETTEDGVTENGVLYTDITFRIIDETVDRSEIKITKISLTDKDGLYKNQSLELADITSEVQLKTNIQNNNSSTDTSFDDNASEEETDTNDTTSADNIDDRELLSTELYIYDIDDPYGISILEFDLSFDASILEFVKYEFIRPSIWVDDEDYTEDHTQTSNASLGAIHFCVLNIDENCGVKQDGILGFRLYFKAPKGTSLDPSLFTITNEYVVNAMLAEVASENYTLLFGQPTLDHADILFNPLQSSDEAQQIQFYITFDPRLCEFVKYELIFANEGNSSTAIVDESKFDTASNGEIFFFIASSDKQTSIVKTGVTGIRIYFETKSDIQFDPSLLTIKSFVVKNVEGETLENAIEGTIDGKEDEVSFWDSKKMTIMIIGSILVLVAGILVVFIYKRKKKYNARA